MKGALIPKEVWFGDDLSEQEKIILCAIFPEAAEKAGYKFPVKELPTEKPLPKQARHNSAREKFRNDLIYGINSQMVKSGFDAETEKAWQQWIDYCRFIKRPLSPFTMKMQIDFLKKQPDPIACINRSIERGWKGLFPIGGENGTGFDGKGGKGGGFGQNGGSSNRGPGGNAGNGAAETGKSNYRQVQGKNSNRLDEQISIQSLGRRGRTKDGGVLEKGNGSSASGGNQEGIS